MDGPHIFCGAFILSLLTVRDYEWDEGEPLVVMTMEWPQSSNDGSGSISEGKFIVDNDSKDRPLCGCAVS